MVYIGSQNLEFWKRALRFILLIPVKVIQMVKHLLVPLGDVLSLAIRCVIFIMIYITKVILKVYTDLPSAIRFSPYTYPFSSCLFLPQIKMAPRARYMVHVSQSFPSLCISLASGMRQTQVKSLPKCNLVNRWENYQLHL